MRKVLVIDDVEGVRRSIMIGLHNSGYEVTAAGSYNEGLGLAISRSFDIILCDLKLPDKSGVDIIRTLKQNDIETPVVAISGFIDATTVESAKEAGAVAYLPKPFLKSDLLALLERIVPPERN